VTEATQAMTDIETAELSQGPIRYREAGTGEPIVFVHGLLVDGRLWDGVAERLAGEHRCIVPDWPMGSHTAAMNPDANLSPAGHAENIAEFIGALGLERATIVGNDSGGAISQILATRHPERVERLVLTNCDMFDRFPPFPFNLMAPVAKLPGGMAILQAPFRIGAVGRMTYAPLAREKIPAELVAAWLEPARRDPGVARDARKLIVGANKRYTLEAAERLEGFDRPTLFPWGTADRFFKLDYAKRLAARIPNSRVVEIANGGTFVPLDRPEEVADAIGALMREAAAVAR
jgi:pimeloyl-ACP methyl ester carboxylesterase